MIKKRSKGMVSYKLKSKTVTKNMCFCEYK